MLFHYDQRNRADSIVKIENMSHCHLAKIKKRMNTKCDRKLDERKRPWI